MSTNNVLIVTELEISKLCRICLTEFNDMVPLSTKILNSDNQELLDIWKILEDVSSLEIMLSELLPSMICKNCLHNAYNAYNFKQQFTKSEALLNACVAQTINTETDNNNIKADLSRSEIQNENFKSTDSENIEKQFMTTNLVENKTEYKKSFLTKSKFHKCLLCDRNFSNRLKLNTHLKIHKIIRERICPLCTQKFPNQILFRQHIQKHLKSATASKYFHICYFCGKVFNLVSEFKSHCHVGFGKKLCCYKFQLGLKRETLTCRVCRKKFKRHSSLKEHMMVHSNYKPFKCEHCNKTFKKNVALKVHLKSHVFYQQFQCLICNKTFRNLSLLKRHFQSHIAKDQTQLISETVKIKQKLCPNKPFDCSTCNKMFKSQRQLKIHEQIHNGKSPYKCVDCGQQFTYYYSIKSHMQTQHNQKDKIIYLYRNVQFSVTTISGLFQTEDFRYPFRLNQHLEKQYLCGLCGKVCKKSGNLRVHLKRHTKFHSWICHICGEGFRKSTNLKKHIQNHTSCWYTCDVCNRTFDEYKTLVQHVKIHSKLKNNNNERIYQKPMEPEFLVEDAEGVKIYTCCTCKKNYNKLPSLKSHLDTHKSQVHLCNLCGKTFTTANYLSAHLRTHNPDRRYTCNLCPKEYKNKVSLRVHMYSHTGYRPFVCHLCAKGFKQRNELNSHLKSHKKDTKKIS